MITIRARALSTLVTTFVLATVALPAACAEARADQISKRAAAVERCNTATMRSLDRYRRGVTTCFALSIPVQDRAALGACRRERVAWLQSRLAGIDMDARRAGISCNAAQLGTDGRNQSWLAELLFDMASSADVCRRSRLRAVGRLVTRAARCATAASPESCVSEAGDRFLVAWTASPDAGCTGVPVDDVARRVLEGLRTDADAQLEECGNGRVEGAEECDDENVEDSDGCDAGCRTETCVETGAGRVCRRCGGGAVLRDDATCACPQGFAAAGGECIDVDECAGGEGECPQGSECVNVPGSYACAIACTQQAFEEAIEGCGGPAHAITFACSDTVIPIADTDGWGRRRVRCDGLVIDGLDRNVTFELAPACFDAAGSTCPDVDDGTGFLLLEGDDITVRNIGVRYFFDGIQTRGRNATVENVAFTRQCDDSVTNALTGVGNVFRDLVIADACDKGSQNYGDPSLTSAEEGTREHYNAIFERVDFVDCDQPLRMTDSGRFLISDTRMFTSDSSEFECRGPAFNTAAANSLFVTIQDSIISKCRRGVRIGGRAQVTLSGNLIEQSDLTGVHIVGEARVSLSANRILRNGGHQASEAGGAGVFAEQNATVDLGGGAVEIDGALVASPGLNVLCDNRAPAGEPMEVDASGVADAASLTTAAHNWWCDEDASHLVAGTCAIAPSAAFPG